MTELLCALGSASAKELCYFTGAANATLRSLEKSGILRLEHREVFRRVTVEAGERAAPRCSTPSSRRPLRDWTPWRRPEDPLPPCCTG
ncbi:MAG: hypothetical protein ACLUES_15585 [Flavonifractor plautii]